MGFDTKSTNLRENWSFHPQHNPIFWEAIEDGKAWDLIQKTRPRTRTIRTKTKETTRLIKRLAFILNEQIRVFS